MALLALSLVAALAGDTTSYAVLNHGRPAGGMLVIRSGDTVIVKYHHYDRQRGPRSETRYVVQQGVVVAGETWPLPLYGSEPVPRPAPADRFEIARDSVLWRVRDSVRGQPRTPNTYYRLRSSTPFDQALAARFLLSRPNRTAEFVPNGGTVRLEIVAD
ncbi:MAG: hypothetical protein ACRENU_08880, partial [Gemmatimonadaceae bacterium]